MLNRKYGVVEWMLIIAFLVFYVWNIYTTNKSIKESIGSYNLEKESVSLIIYLIGQTKQQEATLKTLRKRLEVLEQR